MEELHCDNAKAVALHLPSGEENQQLADFFKALSEPIRVGILSCMLEGEICVHDIALLLGTSQPRVSNQLRILRHHKLVKTKKKGNQIFYSLDDEHVQAVLTLGRTHVTHKHPKEEL